MVRDTRAVEKHINTVGVERARPVEEAGGGWVFSTVLDPPDGNYLQFIQGPATPESSIFIGCLHRTPESGGGSPDVKRRPYR
jgi:hypothetical protein